MTGRQTSKAARRSQIGASYLETDLSTKSSTGIITVETWPTSKDYGVRERGFVGVRSTVELLSTPAGGNNMSSVKDRIRLEKEPLNPEIALVAEIELRETPERIKEATVALRELIRANKNLHYRDDDEFLIRFLRPTKFYPESALALMIRAAEFKVKNASVVKDLMPKDEYKTLVENNVVNVIVDRDQLGRRILQVNVGDKRCFVSLQLSLLAPYKSYCKYRSSVASLVLSDSSQRTSDSQHLEVWDPSKVTANQIFRALYLIHVAACLEPETQVRGVIVIMDFNGLSYRHVKAFTPSFSLLLLSFIQDAMPLRLKEVHMVNQPFIFNAVFQLFKPFIREKLKARVSLMDCRWRECIYFTMYFHGKNMESLHKYMNPDHLPEDYGGKKPKIDYTSKDWYPLLEELEDTIRGDG
uniref:CRAL-TRIO domain-containing protein n=1 Tax=Timema monikensis TaxID=170555 RepID=A0A7R9HQW0_9NEOP|nr:unnamed protein product [Timema monikensis]